VVRSKDHAVSGLTKDDFSVSDNGKPQKIATFRVVEAASIPSNAALPAGVKSNRLATPEEESQGVTVLLIDRLNTDAGDQTEVRRQLLHYLETVRPGERLALYSLNKTLRVIQDFTEDPERLRRMVDVRAKVGSTLSVDTVKLPD